MNKNKALLVTGSSWFIGYHLCKNFLEKGYSIVWIDNENPFYDQKLKEKRRKILNQYRNFHFIKGDLRDEEALQECFSGNKKIETIYHLAAQAGVEYNQNNPKECIENNILAFINLIEAAKKHGSKKIIYASSSSVYGNQYYRQEHTQTDKQLSLYAVSKKCNELIAEMYSFNSNITFIGTRFFSVYWPRGRPDMAYFKFINSLFNNEKITIYGDGKSRRDRTYIDDIIEGLYTLNDYEKAQHTLFNLGNQQSLSLNKMISIIEILTKRKFCIEYLPNKKYDAKITRANIQKAKKELNREAKTDFKTGIKKFIDRYQQEIKIPWKLK